MAFNIICEECGEHFETNWAAAKFCNDYCRLKNWRSKKAKEKKLTWSNCPGCYQRFAHKNPKKEFCTPKCKTAYHRRDADFQEECKRRNRVDRYTPPPTPEEQVAAMLNRAWRDQQTEPGLIEPSELKRIIYED